MKPRLLPAIVTTLCLGIACSSPAPGALGSSRAPATPAAAPDPRDALPSWNDGPSKKALTSFVSRVSTDGSPDFVPGDERIAVFDNDGTLWAEQPIYFQLAFALDRVKALAPQHPEWQTREPFKSVLAGDLKGVMAGGEHALLDIIAAPHAGNTTVEFEQVVKDWVTTAKHPKTGRLYTEMVYQPMREVLDYLRRNGFKTYIVSGGGVEFMRPWVNRVYGIPPEQVVGSRIRMKDQVRNGVPVIVRLAAIDLVDDKAGKPVGIQQVIGRRPRSRSATPMAISRCSSGPPRTGAASWRDRSSHGRRARVGLRPRVAYRTPGAWPGRGAQARLGGRGHEAGVGADLSIRLMGRKRLRQNVRQPSGKGVHANRTSRVLIPLAVCRDRRRGHRVVLRRGNLGIEVGGRWLRQAAPDDGAALHHRLDRREPGVTAALGAADAGRARGGRHRRPVAPGAGVRVPDTSDVSIGPERLVFQLEPGRAAARIQVHQARPHWAGYRGTAAVGQTSLIRAQGFHRVEP